MNECMPVSLWNRYELDAVAVTVFGVEAAHPGNLVGPDRWIARVHETFSQDVYVGAAECRVGFARRAEVFFYTEVQLRAEVVGEPASAAHCQRRRLGLLGHAKHADIELTKRLFAPRRAGKLYVVQHVESLSEELRV